MLSRSQKVARVAERRMPRRMRAGGRNRDGVFGGREGGAKELEDNDWLHRNGVDSRKSFSTDS